MDGRQALACLNGYHPGLIISDIFMPDMNGYELCQHIKRDKSTRDIPVILLTAISDKLDLVEVLACGADSFITKSYDEDYLLSYIEKTMANKSLQKSENPVIELEIAITGTSRKIKAEPHKMISLLLSTYDAAVRRTSELIQTQDN